MKLDIEKVTLKNKNYRKVLTTTKQQQLVVMNVPAGDDIKMEKHPHTTQFIRVEKGKGLAQIGNQRFHLKDGSALVIPANTWHHIMNTGTSDLKLYTIYSPPEHPPNTVQKINPDKH